MERALQDNRVKKTSKKWLWILSFSTLIPLFIIILIPVLVVFFVVVSAMDRDNTLSEYGEGVIPPEYIPIYMEAGRIYGVDWILIAAIHEIETDFSRNLAVSSAGAIGHTQFMKCTWIGYSYPGCSTAPEEVYTNIDIIKKYGGYGVDANGNGRADPWELEDCIHATAKYLSAHMKGATEQERLRNAIFAYNHADWYVDEVLALYSLYSTGVGLGEVVEIVGEKAWVVPYTKNITSFFGQRIDPVTGELRQHNGIDISAGGISGKQVVAFMDGVITYSQFNTGGYGYLVIIDHGNGLQTYYAHLKEQGLPVGTSVKAGQLIGKVGSTGNSTGPHLHFEIRIHGQPVNPLPYLEEFLED